MHTPTHPHTRPTLPSRSETPASKRLPLFPGVVPKPSRQVAEEREHEEGPRPAGAQRDATNVQRRPDRPGGGEAARGRAAREAAAQAAGAAESTRGEAAATRRRRGRQSRLDVVADVRRKSRALPRRQRRLRDRRHRRRRRHREGRRRRRRSREGGRPVRREELLADQPKSVLHRQHPAEDESAAGPPT